MKLLSENLLASPDPSRAPIRSNLVDGPRAHRLRGQHDLGVLDLEGGAIVTIDFPEGDIGPREKRSPPSPVPTAPRRAFSSSAAWTPDEVTYMNHGSVLQTVLGVLAA